MKTNLREKVIDWIQTAIGKPIDNRTLDDYVLETPDGRKITVTILHEGEIFYLYTTLCRVPEKASKEYFMGLLELNLLGLQTRGTTISIDKQSKQIVLHYTAAARNMEAASFANMLSGFIETMEDMTSKAQTLENSHESKGLNLVSNPPMLPIELA